VSGSCPPRDEGRSTASVEVRVKALPIADFRLPI
jgi:hypothetical protein